MKPKDIFGLIVRLVGLYFLYKATAVFGNMVEVVIQAGLVETTARLPKTSIGPSFPVSISSIFLNLLAAIWFFKGVPPFMGWAYPEVVVNAETSRSEPKRSVSLRGE